MKADMRSQQLESFRCRCLQACTQEILSEAVKTLKPDTQQQPSERQPARYASSMTSTSGFPQRPSAELSTSWRRVFRRLLKFWRTYYQKIKKVGAAVRDPGPVLTTTEELFIAVHIAHG
jgi:hypothetical protein